MVLSEGQEDQTNNLVQHHARLAIKVRDLNWVLNLCCTFHEVANEVHIKFLTMVWCMSVLLGFLVIKRAALFWRSWSRWRFLSDLVNLFLKNLHGQSKEKTCWTNKTNKQNNTLLLFKYLPLETVFDHWIKSYTTSWLIHDLQY